MLKLISNPAARRQVAAIFDAAPNAGKQANGEIMVPYSSGIDAPRQIGLYGRDVGVSVRYASALSPEFKISNKARILTFFGSEGVVVHEEVASPAALQWFHSHQHRCANFKGA